MQSSQQKSVKDTIHNLIITPEAMEVYNILQNKQGTKKYDKLIDKDFEVCFIIISKNALGLVSL